MSAQEIFEIHSEVVGEKGRNIDPRKLESSGIIEDMLLDEFCNIMQRCRNGQLNINEVIVQLSNAYND